MLILEAISSGNSDPESLSQLARGSLVKKVEQLRRALKGSVGKHQIAMIGYQVRHIRFLNDEITSLDEEIKRNMQYAEEQISLLDEIPGIGRRSAERILAETGIKMEQFPSASHFCSWAGLTPGCNESAGKRKSSRIRKGNQFLKTVLVESALAATATKSPSYMQSSRRLRPAAVGKRP